MPDRLRGCSPVVHIDVHSGTTLHGPPALVKGLRDSGLELQRWFTEVRDGVLRQLAGLCRKVDEEWTILSTIIRRTGAGGDLAGMTLGQFAGFGFGSDRLNLSRLHSAKWREFELAGISILAARVRALIHQHASPHARFLHRTLFRSQLKPRPTWNRLEPPLSGHSADTAPHLCSFFAGVQQLAVARYPPGTGSAQILRNMSPNSRRVRCPSASRSQ